MLILWHSTMRRRRISVTQVSFAQRRGTEWTFKTES